MVHGVDLTLSRLSITVRTLGGFSVLVVLLAGLTGFSWLRLIDIESVTQAIVFAGDADAAADELNEQINRMNRSARLFLRTRDMGSVNDVRAAARETDKVLDAVIGKFGSIAVFAERAPAIRDELGRYTRAMEIAAAASERQSRAIDEFIASSVPLANVSHAVREVALKTGGVDLAQTSARMERLFYQSRGAISRFVMTDQPDDAARAQRESDRFLAALDGQGGGRLFGADRLLSVMNGAAPRYRAASSELFAAFAFKGKAESDLDQAIEALDASIDTLSVGLAAWRTTAMRAQLAQATALQQITLGTAAAAVIVAIVLTWLIGGSIARPIRRMTDAMQRLAAGDLEVAVPAVGHRDEIGRMAIALEVFRDNARHLRRAKEEAEAATRTKSEFLSNMSHELRTPLNAVIGFAQMLEYIPKEPLTVAQKKCVDRILKGGHHLLEVINEILDLSKIEAGRVELSIEDIALADLLEESRSFVQPLAQRQGISISVSAVSGLLVRADYTRLKQVLLNLFSNAIKYNRPDGRVDISCQALACGRVAIVVADTGAGIPDGKREDLFKPFSRLGQEGSGIEGTGIGLTITKRLVELMGGTLGFDSVVGEGTVFRVALPSSAENALAGERFRSIPRIVADGLRGTVVYIEDNPANIELMEMMFSRLDHVRLLTAPSGEFGIELARSNRPDLIILDLGLPGLDGYEILKRLRDREETRHIPVFALTASATRHDIERGRKAGFDKYLTKPFAIDALIVAMREVFKENRPEGE